MPVLSSDRVVLSALMVAGAAACGDGTSPEPSPPVAAVTRVADVGNSGDGSDLLVRFLAASDETTVSEYRIMVVSQASQATFDLVAAQAVPGGAYTAVAKGQTTVETTLSPGATDVTGAAIVEGVTYVVFVLVVVTEGEDQLSNPSFQITLAFANYVRTLAEIDAGSGGMEVDAAGNIYAADFGAALSSSPGTRVFKITPQGQVSVFATGLNGASGNAFDSNGNLMQSNIAGDLVSRITPAGVVSTFVTEGIENPVGIAIDDADTMYVANCGDNTIRRVTADTVSTHFAGGSLFSCPNGIALASDGNLYVANFSNGNVIKVLPDGSPSLFATLPGNNNGHITFANGVLYVVARAANQLYELQLDGTLTRLAGTGQRGLDDGTALGATLSLTNDAAVSPDGRILYFNDVINQQGTDIISPVAIRMLVLDELFPAPAPRR